MALTAGALFFEEVDEQRRKVFLRGTTGPHGGVRRDPAFSLGGSLRSSRNYEPGEKRPVRHVMGDNERDWEIKGHLRDGQLGIEGEAKRLVQLIDSIKGAGRELRIVWGEFARVGFLVDAEFPVEGPGDYQYRLKFEIDDIANDGRGFGSRPRSVSLGDLTGSLADTLDGHKLALLKVPGLSIDVGSAITDLFGAVTKPLSAMLGALEDIERGVEDIDDALRSAANAAAALLARLEHLAGTLDGISDPIENDDAAALAAWNRARVVALQALHEAAKASYRVGLDSERQIRGGTTARVYVVVDGDTLEAIAAREGTTPEAIRALNPGVSWTPATGTKLRLP